MDTTIAPAAVAEADSTGARESASPNLDALAARVQPAWISDHLFWTGVAGRITHDLLPLPYTEEALDNVVERLRTVQDFLRRRILLETVPSYVASRATRLSAW